MPRIDGLHPFRIEVLCSASGKPAAAIEAERAKYGYARAAASVDELVSDAGVDVVYVASANTAHARHSLAALRAGKLNSRNPTNPGGVSVRTDRVELLQIVFLRPLLAGHTRKSHGKTHGGKRIFLP